MPKAHLTEITIKSLKPPESGQITYVDDTLRGFGVRVSQGGAKAFIVIRGDSRVRTTIGRYPLVSLAEARAKAKELLAERKRAEQVAARLTFKEVLDEFIAIHCAARNSPRTTKETKRLLEKHFLPTLSQRPLDEIVAHDITKVLDKLMKKGRAGTANHAFAVLRTLLRWARARRYIDVNPVEGMSLPSRPVSRDRVLTDAEIVKVYAAAEDIGYPFGSIVQLLILTGQRRTEVASLSWKQVNFKDRTIALTDTKNRHPHVFPYGDAAERVLEGLSRTDDYIFPAQGNEVAPFSGFSKSKARLDKACGIESWTLHDLRRTFATNLAALGTPIQVTEKLLNHVSGTMSGIVSVYQRHTYLAEMRVAVAAWEERLATLRKVDAAANTAGQ